ncbi:hypothetical protein BDY24DRAFT_43941 [Mrakia frigida]|uniref:uncharacterized protein n=1 Tax=Mrakia frigida TaxID=29902 RepID=UPI003FCC0215
MGDQADLWDFGTIRRDQRQATVSRAAPPPVPSIPSSSSHQHLPSTNNNGPQYQQQQQQQPRQSSPQKHSISRSGGSRFGSITSSRSATPTSASTARGTPPTTNANQFPAPPTSLPPPAPQPARSQPSSPVKQHTQPQSQPQAGNGSGYDTIRFAGDIAEQQARIEKGQWTDARGQEGGEYDSDEEEREEREERYDEEEEGGSGNQQHDEDLDDSRAILEDVVVPVIESISQRVPNSEARQVLANLRLAFEEAERIIPGVTSALVSEICENVEQTDPLEQQS